MNKVLNENLSFEDFVNKLRQEYEYHKNGGTEYRQETARLSLDVAMEVKEVKPFLNPLSSKKLVLKHLPLLDNHRKDDVAKMLRVLAKSMYLENNTTNEVKEYVDRKMKNKMKLFIR
ncbi:hypothetical protein ACFSKI_03595 [Pseudogracilibacillus auburnensis]|uniref:Uncharacterized protein n=1 Tax=Pseudogracilibacillus auburnensis TaxID=1494959 RepID=A0A2V3WGT0_9BACI|nr:hypothetical protein [Pseudogracilibacillus auburnensis]MBO1002875.1 hypothetical protein [Pseudogracilibacillus auburnensis]PXW88009.1 hypothetical protein DFR56_104160 [Pseudogracilibacillus auburnensis]